MKTSAIIDAAKAHLARSRNEAETADLPDAGWRWASYQQSILNQIGTFVTPGQVIESVQHPQINFGYEARMTGQDLLAYATAAETGLAAAYPDFASALPSFAETEHGDHATLVRYNGRLVSSALYNLVGHTLKCLSHVKPGAVIEIGGGYGAPGRVWMTNGIHKPKTYIDVDLPESLFFAEVFLRTTLPGLPLQYVNDGDPTDFDAGGIILCPAHQVGKLKGFRADLVMNTSSLQEMTDDYVSYYMRALDDIDANIFYSANYFGQPITSLKESMNFAAPVMSVDWTLTEHHIGGAPDRPSAQAVYRRHAESAQRPDPSTLHLNGPCDLSELFILFDACRFAGNPQTLFLAACATVSRLGYVPKEALFLARAARKLDDSLPTLAVFELLMALAETGLEEMGIVTHTLEATRRDLMQAEHHGGASITSKRSLR